MKKKNKLLLFFSLFAVLAVSTGIVFVVSADRNLPPPFQEGSSSGDYRVKVDGEVVNGLISVEFDIKEVAFYPEFLGFELAEDVDVMANGTIIVRDLYQPLENLVITANMNPFQLVLENSEEQVTISIDECYVLGKNFYVDKNEATSEYYFVGVSIRVE